MNITRKREVEAEADTDSRGKPMSCLHLEGGYGTGAERVHGGMPRVTLTWHGPLTQIGSHVSAAQKGREMKAPPAAERKKPMAKRAKVWSIRAGMETCSIERKEKETKRHKGRALER